MTTLKVLMIEKFFGIAVINVQILIKDAYFNVLENVDKLKCSEMYFLQLTSTSFGVAWINMNNHLKKEQCDWSFSQVA